MRARRRALPLAIGAAAGAGAAIGGAAVLQRRHIHAIAADPAAPSLVLAPGRELSVRSSDGTLLHAEVFGPDDAPTIILAHGWVEALRLWVHQIHALCDSYRVVAYDQRGHGASGRAASGSYSTGTLAEDLDAVLDAVLSDGERAVVAGHSMGAMAIVAWAEEHDVSARLAGAALMNTGVNNLIAESRVARTPLDKALREPIARRLVLGSLAPVPRFSSPVHHAIARHAAFSDDSGPASVELLLGMVRQCRAADRAAFGLAMADMNLHHALARLTVPTLLMAGSEDRLTPVVHAERMAAELPDLVDLVILPGAAHMGPLERPAEYSSALRALAERAFSQAPAAASA